MKNEKEQLDTLQDIRKMMKESSKFLSLSGLSGVFAGIYALVGAYMAHQAIRTSAIETSASGILSGDPNWSLVFCLGSIALAVLFLAICTALYLSGRKAKKLGQRLFDHTSQKLFWAMAIPLLSGGLFCLALLVNHSVLLIGPAMLLFYGIALVNISKYTLSEIKYLGLLEMGLGLASSFYTGYSLFFWALGFGILHIIYGSIMWFKYDRD